MKTCQQCRDIADLIFRKQLPGGLQEEEEEARKEKGREESEREGGRGKKEGRKKKRKREEEENCETQAEGHSWCPVAPVSSRAQPLLSQRPAGLSDDSPTLTTGF